MSNRPAHSLGKRLLPAVVITASATGLIALLDRPASGSIGDTLGGPLGDGPLDGATDGPLGTGDTVQPPEVSSTVPAVITGDDDGSGEDQGEDEGEDEGDDSGEDSGEEDDNGFPIVTPTQPTPTTPPTTTIPSTPVADGPCQGSTVDGPSVNTRWGPVQVEAIVSSSGQICDVGAIRSPDSHRRSVRINEQALPILHDQVMKAQSADIRGVSGATVTSEGYVRSLQAILDGSAG